MTIKDAWIAEGVAKSLLRLLESRAITISEAVRARVLDTRDESLLWRWFDRAVSMTTAEEVFAPVEAGS